MQATVELGRSIRTKKDLALKQLFLGAVVIHPEASVHKEIMSMKPYVVEVSLIFLLSGLPAGSQTP